MQVKNEVSENEGKKRNIVDIIFTCVFGAIFVILQASFAFSIWPECIFTEQERFKMFIYCFCICFWCVMAIYMPYIFLKDFLKGVIKDKKKRRRIFIVIAVISAIIDIIIPFALQGVYHATKENIVITEKTYIVSTETIYLIGNDKEKQQIKEVDENDVIEVHFEQNAQPYVEVVKYCTILTRDNQNPWGRKTNEVIKEWKQYEFHLPASEVSN